MLHELLLALSGHPSVLFNEAAEDFPFITPAETNLLQSLGRLASLNRALQSHASRVSSTHPSTICRAVANDLCTRQLPRFRQRILEVENSILSSNPVDVGAYNTVPLAGLIGDFAGWERKLEWCWKVLCFILPPESGSLSTNNSPCKDGLRNGAALINSLKQDTLTGYPEIEGVASSLLKTAESVWLKQLSGWLLQGDVSKHAASDFFIQPRRSPNSLDTGFSVSYALLPDFVASDTAHSILYIGNTLNYLKSTLSENLRGLRLSQDEGGDSFGELPRLQNVCLLATLESPISPTALNAAISDMRLSMTRRLIHGLLPVQKITETLSSLRDFFLLHRIGFTDALVIEADQHLQHRHAQIRVGCERAALSSLTGAMMKEAEVSGVLAKVWSSLASQTARDVTLDDGIDWGRENLLLELDDPISHSEESTDGHAGGKLIPSLSSRVDNAFSDFLLSAPTKLSMKPKPPLSLFLSKHDVHVYSTIHAYLLSIRRAHAHLAGLWRRSSLRRGSPVVGGSRGSNRLRIERYKKLRTRNAGRERSMRATWATAKAALCLLTKFGEFLVSEVVAQSWNTFQRWFSGTAEQSSYERPSVAVRTATHGDGSFFKSANGLQHSGKPVLPVHTKHEINERAQDPELLALAHRQYLAALQSSLLLTDRSFTRMLRDFLSRVDELVAFIGRLQSIYGDSDLHDEGVLENLNRDYKTEEQDVLRAVIGASTRVEESMKRFTDHLRDANAARSSHVRQQSAKIEGKTGFEPWTHGSLDQLLLRLQSNDDLKQFQRHSKKSSA